jgi:hypothetical protein
MHSFVTTNYFSASDSEYLDRLNFSSKCQTQRAYGIGLLDQTTDKLPNNKLPSEEIFNFLKLSMNDESRKLFK